MASSLINRSTSTNLLRQSLSLLRNFSASYSSSSSPTATTSDANPTAPASTAAAKKPKSKKKKNLFEVAQFLPNWGVGYHMAKSHWVGVSYEITKINLYKDGKHGKAWGVVYKEGLQAADAPKKISGVHKRCWKYISNGKKTKESPQCTPNLKKTEESTQNPEVQAA